jgi:membrane protein YdbS with pleckstrin-like domain
VTVSGAVMGERLRSLLLRWLRVPAEPAPPPGDPGTVLTFRAARNYFRYIVVTWALKQLSAGAGLVFSYLFFRQFVPDAFSGAFTVLEQLAIAGFVLQLPFSYALLRLNFEMRWYILSDRSLRIRSGIVSVREQTMTFANVQNISIHQNPLQRIFGIATVAVRAAGGGATGGGGAREGGSAHEATFEGVDNAPQIRTAIRERIRRHRDAGLGDPDELQSLAGTTVNGLQDAVAAARQLQEEAAGLREAFLASGTR